MRKAVGRRAERVLWVLGRVRRSYVQRVCASSNGERDLIGCVEDEKSYQPHAMYGVYGVRMLGGSCGSQPRSAYPVHRRKKQKPRQGSAARPEKVTICGPFDRRPRPGSTVRALGHWSDSESYGVNFEASHVSLLPSSEGGSLAMIIALSRNLDSVGETRAQRIIDTLNVSTLHELESELDKSSAPSALRRVSGISKAAAHKLKEQWDQLRGLRVLLEQFGVPEHAISALTDADVTSDQIVQNPYESMLGIDASVPITILDRIATDYGLSLVPTSEPGLSRVQYALLDQLLSTTDQQSCTFVPVSILWQRTNRLLHQVQPESSGAGKKIYDDYSQDLPSSTRNEALEQLVSRGYVCIENQYDVSWLVNIADDIDDSCIVFPRSQYFAELNTAKQTAERLAMSHTAAGVCMQSEAADIAEEVQGLKRRARDWVDATERQNNLELTDEQKDAIVQSATHTFGVITGGPGTGKSFTIQMVVRLWIRMLHEDERIAVVAPTGRAAVRLEAALRDWHEYENHSARIAVSTVHRLLESRPAGADARGSDHIFERNKDNKLEVSAVVCDESTMMSMELSSALLDALPDKARVVLAGDVDQLPSVSPGYVFENTVGFDPVPKTVLTRIFRQEAGSPIISFAHQVNQQKYRAASATDVEKLRPPPSEEGRTVEQLRQWAAECARGLGDVSIVPVTSGEQAQSATTSVATFLLPQIASHASMETQILSPVRDHAGGVSSLNVQLQNALNSPHSRKGEITRGAQLSLLREGDKVMQSKNNYDKFVFNGDVGIVRSAVHGKKGQGVLVDYSPTYPTDSSYETSHVEYEGREIFELDLAWATTVHKSQGGQFDVVVFCCPPRLRMDRQLLYTAISRAANKLILVTSDNALERASMSKPRGGEQKKTMLLERLQSKYNQLAQPVEATKATV